MIERRLSEIAHELDVLFTQSFNQADLVSALGSFGEIWEMLYPVEQARIMWLLVEWVEYDGHSGAICIQPQPAGIQSLASDVGGAESIAAE